MGQPEIIFHDAVYFQNGEKCIGDFLAEVARTPGAAASKMRQSRIG
jgi:hypothetical protein